MQRIRILCVGKIKAKWLLDGCEEYLTRLKPVMKITLVEVPASKARTPELQMAEESERLLHWMEQYSGNVWVLDERGVRKSSQEFTDLISGARDRGEELTFVIGGAYGLTEPVRKMAKGVLRISDMTLTHEFTRALLLEQLYRAAEIAKGSGYHH
ncbi:23S rRNA (pseudouridine(1915)-N(3))-methyltransferase RlmH [Candidatus Peregrinibacteria bacterium]|nr:23S rRNA (pseudouridine(1915)-N(3))-methyltransferase RlmH [Candidatus Peregrinibacteria bacterium]